MINQQPVSVLMPVCNEATVIRRVVAEWHESVLSRLPLGSEMLFDDCSVDGTADILQELSGSLPFIRVNCGARDGFFSSAIRLYRMARNDILFFTDSDGQYVAEDFWDVYRHLDRYDLVHGYKTGRCDPIYRTLGSHFFNFLTRAYFRSGAVDVNSAFRLVHRRPLTAVLGEIRHLRMMPNAEMYLRLEHLGFRIRHVPVRHRPRVDGTSRSLPLGAFAREGIHAVGALRRLRRELTNGSGSRNAA